MTKGLLNLLGKIVETAIYARVSTTTNQSLETQLRVLRELAGPRGFEIVSEGQSGSGR